MKRIKLLIYRALGIASPSGAYPPPLSRVSRKRGQGVADGVRSGSVSLASVAAGPCGGDPFDQTPCTPVCKLGEYGMTLRPTHVVNGPQGGGEGPC